MQIAWNHARLDLSVHFGKAELVLLTVLGSVAESRQMVFGLDAYIVPLE
jgi:hypothetical protein